MAAKVQNIAVVRFISFLRRSVFDKTPIQELLTDFQVNQNVKERQCNLVDKSVKC
jgi:hypothetical protein